MSQDNSSSDSLFWKTALIVFLSGDHFSWPTGTAFLEISHDQLRSIVIYPRRLNSVDGCRRVRAFKSVALIDCGLNLGFERKVAQGRIHGLAADNAVVVVFRAAIGGSDEVLATRFAHRNRLMAEEADIALQEQQAFELFHCMAAGQPSLVVAVSRRC